MVQCWRAQVVVVGIRGVGPKNDEERCRSESLQMPAYGGTREAFVDCSQVGHGGCLDSFVLEGCASESSIMSLKEACCDCIIARALGDVSLRAIRRLAVLLTETETANLHIIVSAQERQTQHECITGR